jgi:PAS domain S-box-containing protein
VLVVLSLCSGGLPAQPPDVRRLDPTLRLTQYVHEVWTTEHGLPSNTVAALAQTPEGYLWLGTAFGLVRFDGVRCKVFNTRNTPDLPDDDVRSLLADAGGLWIGTHRGCLIHWQAGRFTPYRRRDGLPDTLVCALYRDRKGDLWVGTGDGLARRAGERFLAVPGVRGRVNALAEDSAGVLWVGADSGAHLVKDGRVVPVADRHGPLTSRVRALCPDGAGGVWLGTAAGLVRLHKGQRTTYTPHDGLSGRNILSLARDQSGDLWIGTWGAGLNRYRGGRFETFGTRAGLADDVVAALLEDREGSLWVGTFNGGLSRLRNPLFTTYTASEGFPAGALLSVSGDRDGTLWVGTDGAGLVRFRAGQASRYTTQDGLPSDIVLSTWRSADGLWIGTRDGLARLEHGRIVNLSGKDGFPAGQVRALYEDRGGSLWIASDRGLQRWRAGRLNDELLDLPGWLRCNIVAIREGRPGTLWLATVSGVVRLQGGRATKYGRPEGLRHDVVEALCPDGDAVWIGTEDGSLHLWRDGTIMAFPLGRRVRIKHIWAILEDGRGQLWLTTTQGILRVDKRALLAAAGKTRFPLRLFDRLDGLRTVEMDGGGGTAGWKTPDGRLWFACKKGLVMLDPGGVRPSRPPPAAVEELRIDGRTVPLAEGLELPPGKGRLEFRYTALSLRTPRRTRFRYRLEGFDEAWVEAGRRRVAFYTHVPGGRYRFLVQAANDEGDWGPPAATPAFGVRPYFYQTAWFYALAAAGLVLFGAGLYPLRTRRLRRRASRLERLVAEQTQALRQEVAERQQAQEALRRSHDELEQRVLQRTADLAGVNEALERDMAERIRAEQALRQSQHLLQAIIDNSMAVVYVKDIQGRFLLINRRFEELFHVSREEAAGKTDYDLFPRERAEAFRAFDARVLAAGAALESEEVAPQDDGLHTYISVKCPLYDEAGRPYAVCGISTDITERKRAEDELFESRQMLRTILDTIPQRVFWKDRNSVYVGCNKPLAQDCGFADPGAIVGKNDYETNGAPLADLYRADDRCVMETGRPKLEYEEPSRRADGSQGWLKTSKVPLCDKEGRVIGVLGTYEDITERKHAEEQLRASLREKEALLKEIHHRVKNNLQIIVSLLNLQAAQIKDPAVLPLFAESQNRVRSMALVHENLYRTGNLAAVDLAPHVEGLCAHLYRCYGIDTNRIELHTRIAPVTLDLERAVPCGLIINELVSNALKYAFPAGRRGRVRVELGVEQDRRYTLVVADDGVGLPAGLDFRRTETLGLQLVCGLAQQLGGSIGLEGGAGTAFQITFAVK